MGEVVHKLKDPSCVARDRDRAEDEGRPCAVGVTVSLPPSATLPLLVAKACLDAHAPGLVWGG